MAEERNKRRRLGSDPEFCLAKDCINLRLISTPQEFHSNAAKAFSPDFLEEHFGEEGKIFGYRGLRVDIWLHSSSFHAFVDIKYDAVAPVPGRKKSQRSVQEILKDAFGPTLVEDRDSFLKQLDAYSTQFSDMLTKYGEQLSSWPVPSHSSSCVPKQNQIFRLEATSFEVKEWRRRLSPLVLWFVEAATAIDVDDDRWEVYVAVQDRHKVTGFCNVYRFFHYPDSVRLRISQILVLPPYQQQQFGLHLVGTVNDVAIQRKSYDVTMEDPSDRLQKLRDCMDVVRLLACSTVMSALIHALGNVAGETKGKARAILLPPPELASVVRERLKINKSQFKRCWEVLILLHMDPAQLSVFRELLWEKLLADYYESKENNKGPKKKRVIDTENDYDSSKTFLMMRFKQTGDDTSLEGQEEDQETIKALEGLLNHRETEVVAVVKKVVGICKLQHILVQFRPQAWMDKLAYRVN